MCYHLVTYVFMYVCIYLFPICLPYKVSREYIENSKMCHETALTFKIHVATVTFLYFCVA